MLERLKRPGYWIILLAVLTVYSYQKFQHNESTERKDSLMKLYRSYADAVFTDLRDRRIIQLQSRFAADKKEWVDLEEIALFIDTLHLDRNGSARWKEIRQEGEDTTLSGELLLEGNLSYPIDMIVVRRGQKMLLRGVKVAGRELKMGDEGFPLEQPGGWVELNESKER